MFSVNIPLNASDKETLTVRMKQTFGDGDYVYKKDQLESKEDSFLLRISSVVFLKDLNLGVYARQPIKKGTVIGYYEGEYVDLTVQERDTIYLMYLNDDNTRGIDAMTVFNWTRFMNHSDFSFNCDFLLQRNTIQIITVKDVEEGEQLLNNYGPGYNFKEKFFIHSSHNHQFPSDIVNDKRDCYIDFSSNDFDALLAGDRNIFWDKPFDKASLTTLSKQVINDLKLNRKDIKAMVERPSYIFKTTFDIESVCLQEITPLMLACYKGLIDKVKTLLQYGADPLRGSFNDGRNSFAFTILSKASIESRTEILQQLMKNIERNLYQTNADQFDLLFLHGKDVRRMSVFDYLCGSNLVFNVCQGNRLIYFKTKILTGEFPNRFSENVLGQMRIEDIQLDLPGAIPFHTKTFELIKNKPSDSDDIEKNDYFYMKHCVDHKRNSKIKECLERFDNQRQDEDKSLEMYKQVFTHSIAYIKSNIDFKEINQANEIFSYFKCKINWEMKMEIFDYALKNVKFWHGRMVSGKEWNSNAGIEYIQKMLSDAEFSLLK